MKSGAELISDERTAQSRREGYDSVHDDSHDDAELARAASAYLNHAVAQVRGANDPGFRAMQSPNPPHNWPWDAEEWKPSDTVVGNLVKAGALIAAEIDRIRRQVAGACNSIGE